MKHSEAKRILYESKEFSEAMRQNQINFDLAKAVVVARLKKGWSQSDLANAVGTKQANISRIESGQSNVTITLLKKIVNSLEIRVLFVDGEKYNLFSSSINTETSQNDCNTTVSLSDAEIGLPECVYRWVALNYEKFERVSL